MSEPLHNRRQNDMDELGTSFSMCPKYDKHELTSEQIAEIAEAAAQRAVQIARENFYKDVGKSVISKWFVIVGMGTVALYAWARSKNII